MQCKVIEQDRCVKRERTPETPACDSEVLVDHEDHKPKADDDALLQQEQHVAASEKHLHQRVAFAAAHVEPSQGEERVQNVEHQNAQCERDVLARIGVDVNIFAFARPPTALSAVKAKDRIPAAGWHVSTISRDAALFTRRQRFALAILRGLDAEEF